MAFISYWASINLFGHIHTINGTTITHSHPFKSNGDHNHSNNALFTILSLTNFSTDDVISHNSLLNFVAPFISEIVFNVLDIFSLFSFNIDTANPNIIENIISGSILFLESN